MNFTQANGTALRYDVSGSGERAVAHIREMGGMLESWDGVRVL